MTEMVFFSADVRQSNIAYSVVHVKLFKKKNHGGYSYIRMIGMIVVPYQPLLIKPIFIVLVHAEKQGFFKTSLPVFILVFAVIIDMMGTKII